MEVIPDPLESRFDKLFRKYLNDRNGVRMNSWRPSQVVSILQSKSSLRDASSLLIQSIVPELNKSAHVSIV
jgi:hypothetical protein